MQCKYRVGFFIIRECMREGALPCGTCGKPVCDAHRNQAQADLTTISTQVTCIQCSNSDPFYRDRHSSHSNYSSDTSSSLPSSFSGSEGGSSEGAGSARAWSGSSDNPSTTQSATALGAIPTALATASDSAAAENSDPSSILGSAGLSEEDAKLFDQVSDFDESKDSKSSYDS
jgi:hypothetical protein